ncbi:hypothetical protein [Flavobacterium sp. W21_SRS_FM6]|uniref:hypothetical protein n=1 Tax=Flavobacterium sp. W21_SRS_FM6 TaxID=3240268 RepID=UPI003F926941
MQKLVLRIADLLAPSGDMYEIFKSYVENKYPTPSSKEDVEWLGGEFTVTYAYGAGTIDIGNLLTLNKGLLGIFDVPEGNVFLTHGNIMRAMAADILKFVIKEESGLDVEQFLEQVNVSDEFSNEYERILTYVLDGEIDLVGVFMAHYLSDYGALYQTVLKTTTFEDYLITPKT